LRMIFQTNHLPWHKHTCLTQGKSVCSNCRDRAAGEVCPGGAE
jgi:hypothetical protein